MKTLHMMVGFPRSGKSSKASDMNYPIVCPDSIRKACGWFPFVPEMESLVWGMARVMVASLLMHHDNVILDACNHTKARRQIWQSDKWVVKYHVMPADKHTCIQRAHNTSKDYLVPVIEKMNKEYEPVGMADNC